MSQRPLVKRRNINFNTHMQVKATGFAFGRSGLVVHVNLYLPVCLGNFCNVTYFTEQHCPIALHV